MVTIFAFFVFAGTSVTASLQYVRYREAAKRADKARKDYENYLD